MSEKDGCIVIFGEIDKGNRPFAGAAQQKHHGGRHIRRGRRPRRPAKNAQHFSEIHQTAASRASSMSKNLSVVACNIKNFMQLNVGNGYGRSAVPSFVIHKCWAQRYIATNSPNIAGDSYVSPRNGHNRSLHWRITSFRCYNSVGATLGRPRILQSKIPSPQGENMVISLREIRKTPFFGGRSRIAPTSFIAKRSSLTV